MGRRTGVARLRQAITNQATCGSGQFELSIDDADRLCREVEDELAHVSWAKGVPAPVDADGEVVPLTAEVMYDEDDRECKGSYLIWSRERGQWYFGVAGGSREVASLHLHRPDSWEELERDARKAPRDYIEGRGIATEFGGRVTTMANDILCRARALARRDAKGTDRG